MPLFTNIAGNRIVKLAVRGAADNWNYDLYMATNPTDFCDASGSWSWQGQGTNGQILSVTNPPTNQVFFMLRSPLATNVLVNDPAQDEGNLQNTQSETTLIAFSNIFGNLAGHMGDYDAAVADDQCVYYTWGDNRETCAFTNGAFVVRNQADVRFVRIPWPQ